MSTQPTPPKDQQPSTVTDVSSMDRRRVLLKGLGKGSAVVAATIPIQTLANTSTVYICGDNRQCTVSGIQSAAHSFSSGIAKVTASGKGAAYWDEKNPNYDKPQNWKDYKDIPFGGSALAAYPSATSTKTLWELLKPGSTATLDQKTWVYAYLNAILNATLNAGKYPFTKAEVQEIYSKSQASSSYAATALDLLKNKITYT